MYNFVDYDKDTYGHAGYPLMGSNMVYPALKLAGESGELADKIGKHWRNESARLQEGLKKFRQFPSKSRITSEAFCVRAMNATSLTPEQHKAIMFELGDVLWYVNALAHELGTTLEEVARMNSNKLADRRLRGVIMSEGDFR